MGTKVAQISYTFKVSFKSVDGVNIIIMFCRFMSSKSGRIYLHSDIRMIIFRKSDMDTATAHGIDMCYELRSFTHIPANPKYSPRK